MSTKVSDTEISWAEANRTYLETGLEMLRLRLRRHIRWLRIGWGGDSLRGFKGMVISDDHADWLLEVDGLGAEHRFLREHEGAAEWNRQLAELSRRRHEWADRMERDSAPPALAVLAAVFGLDEVSQAALLAAFAVEWDLGFERLFGYAQDDIQKALPTRRLLFRLLADPARPEAAWQALGPQGPLFRRHLVLPGGEVDASQSSRPFSIDPRIADYLLGDNHLDPRLEGLLLPVGAGRLAPAQMRAAERLRDLLGESFRSGPVPVVNLIAPSGGGRAETARWLSEQFGLALAQIPLEMESTAGLDRSTLFALLEREATLVPLAYFLYGGEGPAERRFADDFCRRVGNLIFTASRDPWICPRRETVPVRLPVVGAPEQIQLWAANLRDRLPDPEAFSPLVAEIVQQFNFGPAQIGNVIDLAQRSSRLHRDGNGAPTERDLWEACRQFASRPLARLAQPITPVFDWNDIVLPTDVEAQLREIANQARQRGRVYEDWGFGAKLSRGRGISALFSGASGTGKTMAAEILATELNLSLYRIDLASVISKYIGETEKNLCQVFDSAEQSGAILFFDEADALFGKRSEVKDSHDRYANIEINYLLQRMEDYRGLAVLATNKKSHLDEAFLRRLRFLVDFPFPDAASRRRMWQRVFPEQARLGALDYDFLSRLEITGGNIRNIALNAAFLAAAEDAPIDMPHLLKSIRREYAKIERLIRESEFGGYYTRLMERNG